MAKAFPSLFLLLLSLSSVVLIEMGVSSSDQKTWCIAKPSSEETTLQANINYACSEIDCKFLQQPSSCFIPNNLINHASIAMNLYYQAKGRNPWNCYFQNSGLLVLTDPSYGSCVYN